MWAAGAPNHEIQKPIESHQTFKRECLFSWRSVPGATVVELTIMGLCFCAIQRYLSIPHFLYLYLLLTNFSLLLSPLPHIYALLASPLSSFLSPLHLTHSSFFSSLLPRILPLLTFPPLIFPFFPSCFLPIIIFLLFFFSLTAAFTRLVCWVSHPLPSSATSSLISFLVLSTPPCISLPLLNPPSLSVLYLMYSLSPPLFSQSEDVP